MNKLLLLGLSGLGLLALASKSSAQEASPSTPATPKPSTPKPSTPKTKTVNVPLQVVENLLKGVGSPDGQISWLIDNGFPKTADALDNYTRGKISADALILTATSEGLAKGKSATVTTAKGSPVMDSYGAMLLEKGSLNEIYSFAIDSNSIPFVQAAAAELALKGDTRAIELTQHLADIST